MAVVFPEHFFFMYAGNILAGGNGEVTPTLVAPVRCQLVAVLIHNDNTAAFDTLTTFDIKVEGTIAPSGIVQVQMPATAAANSGHLFEFGRPANLEAGNRILLESNGETTTAPECGVTFVFKPLDAKYPNSIIYLPLPKANNLTIGSGSTDPVTAPSDCEILGFGLAASANIDVAAVLDIEVDGVDTGENVTVPTSIGVGGGGLFVAPTDKVFLSEGQSVRLGLNGGPTTSPEGYFTAICRRMSAEHSLREYSLYAEFEVIHTAVTMEPFAVPEASDFVGIRITPHDGPPDATTLFTLLINNVSQGQVAQLVDADLDDISVFFTSPSRISVAQGDGVTISSNAGQISGMDVAVEMVFRR